MTDEELERIARAATAGPWQETQGHPSGTTYGVHADTGPVVVFRGIAKPQGQGANNARFIAAFNPATVLTLLERVRRAEAALLCEHGAEKEYCAASFNAATENAKRSGLLLALKQAEDVEREELAAGHSDSASGAEEVKDRIKERIRWLDEGTE